MASAATATEARRQTGCVLWSLDMGHRAGGNSRGPVFHPQENHPARDGGTGLAGGQAGAGRRAMGRAWE